MPHGIQDFLNIKTAWAENFSPDASKLLVQSNLSGTMQLYRVDSGGGSLVQITDYKEPVSGVYLPTSDEILLQMDEGGNEKLQIYLLDDSGKERRDVVCDPEYIHRLGGVTRDGSSIAYACNRRNGVDFDVFVRALKSDDERSVFDQGGLCQPVGFSPDGRHLTVSRTTEKPGDNDLYLIDLATGDVDLITPHDDEAHFGVPSWLPDGSAFFFATDHDREFQSIARFDLSEREYRIVIEPPWDASCIIDWTGQNLLLDINEDGYDRLEIRDPSTLELREKVDLPGIGRTGPKFSRDGRYIAYSYTSFVEPGDVWIYDIASAKSTRLTTSPNPVSEEEFIEPEVHRFQSFDGETIPAFVARPKSFEGEKPPVIVMIHGGPEGQTTAMFNPISQYFLHRGYAVVAPNVRGSIGYGKRFQHLDDVRKRLDSVKDLEALHRWMGSIGLDTDRAVLYGGSYGGYMVLAGLAFQPELWSAGIDIVGISSLVTFLENTAPWRRKFREREYGSLETDRDFLNEVSPLTHIDKIEAPLFIIHGRNDPRVPVGEAEQIHKVLREKGVPTEMVIYDDEGHGLQKLKNRLDAYPKAIDFVDRVLPPNR
jgi:dipeptidyl aminopeptidase/acylaminoacyl peptidase